MFLWLGASLLVATLVPLQGEPEFVALSGKKYYPTPDARGVIAQAQARVAEDPANAELLMELGLTYASLRHYRQAIETFSRGIELKPDWAPLYRHRGHRYITLRDFPNARRDLEKASQLDPEDFDIHYLLALSYYLSRDFEAAATGFQKGLELAANDDDRIGATYWLYVALRRLGRSEEAELMLEPIRPGMRVERNVPNFKLLALFKGGIEDTELLNPENASPRELATYGYGVAVNYLFQGQERKARQLFEKVVDGPYWPAFGYIAAESEIKQSR